MLDWGLIAIGLGIGVAVAAPMGPVNIMIIHRGVRHGFLSAFVAGLGAVVGDGLYAAIAAFGVTTISDFITANHMIIKSLGGLLLIGFSLHIVLSKPHPEQGVEEDNRRSMFGSAAASFVMCITNPALLLGFAAIFTGLDEIGRAPDNYASAIELTLAVMAGGLLWWFFLSAVVSRFRTRITLPWLRAINIAAGIALGVFGVLLLLDATVNVF